MFNNKNNHSRTKAHYQCVVIGRVFINKYLIVDNMDHGIYLFKTPVYTVLKNPFPPIHLHHLCFLNTRRSLCVRSDEDAIISVQILALLLSF